MVVGGGGERDLLERSPRQMTDMKRGAGRRARPAVYSCSSLALPLELVPSAPAMGCCASAPGSPGGESAVARARREARGVAIPHFNRSGVTDACVLSDPSGSAARLFAGLDARRGANAYISDPYRGEPIARWHAHDKPVSRVAWLPRARKLLTASRDGTCALWSDPQQIPDDDLLRPGGGGFAPALATYRAGDLPVTGLCSVEERGVFVTASRDYSVKVWDLEAATSVVTSPSSASRVSRNVATHLRRVPGEPLVVQTSEDLRVRVFDLRVPLHEAAAVQTLESGHGDIPKCVDVAEDGVTVLVGANGFERGAGCELRVFDRRALRRSNLSSSDPGSSGGNVTCSVREMRGHEAAVNGVAFVPGVRGAGGGAIAVSASTDRTVRVWDCGRGDEIGPVPLRFDGYEKSPGDAGAVTCVAAAPPEVGGEGGPGAFVAGEYGGKTQAWRIVDGGTGETVSEAWTEGEAPEE